MLVTQTTFRLFIWRHNLKEQRKRLKHILRPFLCSLLLSCPPVPRKQFLQLRCRYFLHHLRRGKVPRYPFIRLSMNPEDYFSPHPVFHTFFGFDSPSVGAFFQGKSSHPVFHTFFAFGRKNYQTFLRKDSRHSLSFDNQIKKYLSRNLFSDKQKAEKENRIG